MSKLTSKSKVKHQSQRSDMLWACVWLSKFILQDSLKSLYIGFPTSLCVCVRARARVCVCGGGGGGGGGGIF